MVYKYNAITDCVTGTEPDNQSKLEELDSVHIIPTEMKIMLMR